MRSPIWSLASITPIVAAAASAAHADPHAAGPRRSAEVSGFLGIDYFGGDIELGNSWAGDQIPGTAIMFGARLGLILAPDLMPTSSLSPQAGVELEAKAAAAFTDASFEDGRPSYFSPVLGYRAHALVRLAGIGVFAPHVVAGLGGESVASTSPYMADETDVMFYYGTGGSWRVSRNWDVRIDLRHGLTAGRTDAVASTFELQLGAGARFDLAGATPPPRPPRDTDGDGRLDRDDTCPSEPETKNGFRDDDGCPDVPDQDGDGLIDDVDTCPFDAEAVNGIDDQDGCPEGDDDFDGIVGTRDTCPDRPEDRDNYKDDDGCPDPDDDGDGVDDQHDTCPADAEVFNGVTDGDGCPDDLPPAIKAFEGVIAGINFATNKAVILPNSHKALDGAVAVLKEFPAMRVRIEGHTDGRGPREKNVDLSRRRAESVKWYLVDQGIAEDRIETEGVGPDRPIADDKTAAGQAKNRRIEFHVIVSGTAPAAPAPAPNP